MYISLRKHYSCEKNEKYKTYKRTLDKILNNARRTFYAESISEMQGQYKQMWKTINRVPVVSKNKPNEYPQTFLVKDELIGNHKKIAEMFNDYFTNIGPGLANKYQIQLSHHFKTCLLRMTILCLWSQQIRLKSNSLFAR